MTQQTINTGVIANDATGDPLQVAFTKCNANFSQLFNTVPFNVTAAPYNADPSGSFDSTTGIQAAINAAAALNGGIVYLPPGTYKIGSAGIGLSITKSNVQLIGVGSAYTWDSGTGDNPATTLIWGGSSAPTTAMVNLASPIGASLQAQSGVGVSNILLNCNSLAGYGIKLVSIKKGIFSQLYVKNPITAAYYLTTLVNGQLAQGIDTQHNIFTQCLYRCTDSSASIKAHGFQLTNALPSSSTNGNTSFNTFIECLGENNGLLSATSGIGYKIDAGDNNSFINCIGYRTSGTTVPSVQLNGNNPSSDGNVFYHYSDTTAANAINILGNATLGSGFNPTQNCFIGVDSNNGVNYPTLDTGCRVFWHDTNGAILKGIGTTWVMSDAEATALTETANVTGQSLRIRNGGSNHIQLTDGTNIWGLNIDGSGNCRFSRVAGTGVVLVGANLQAGAAITSAVSVAPAAGGSSACGTLVSSTANLGVFFGTGVPTFSAAEGSIYSDTTGGAGARLYVNTSAGSGTTWTAAASP